MAVYAIGDIQGCDAQLGELLARLNFSADRDQVWFVGDLVNRGPASLQVLRRIHALGDAAQVVLGNHDIHLLAVALQGTKPRSDDTLDPVLAAPDRKVLLDWLLTRPLLHEDTRLNVCMLHAGLPPQWDLAMARRCAREVEAALQRDPVRLLRDLYGDTPDLWNEELTGSDRYRFIANCFTRLRYLDADGRLAMKAKGSPADPPKKTHGKALVPWFEAPAARWRGPRMIFGHWSTLGFFRNHAVTGMDTGCVWGNRLTALQLDKADASPIEVGCHESRAITV